MQVPAHHAVRALREDRDRFQEKIKTNYFREQPLRWQSGYKEYLFSERPIIYSLANPPVYASSEAGPQTINILKNYIQVQNNLNTIMSNIKKST